MGLNVSQSASGIRVAGFPNQDSVKWISGSVFGSTNSTNTSPRKRRASRIECRVIPQMQ